MTRTIFHILLRRNGRPVADLAGAVSPALIAGTVAGCGGSADGAAATSPTPGRGTAATVRSTGSIGYQAAPVDEGID